MAIRDALWACPLCRRVDAIRPRKGAGEICNGCGASFRAGPGATISATPPGGPARSRTVPEWEAELPDLLLAAGEPAEPTPGIFRVAAPARAIRAGNQLLGWAERFGPRLRVTFVLEPDHLAVVPAKGADKRWPLELVVAVQPSSSSVQLRIRDGELISLSFPDSSVRLWEVRLQAAVRNAYARAGRGVITEFHPTIRTRPTIRLAPNEPGALP